MKKRTLPTLAFYAYSFTFNFLKMKTPSPTTTRSQCLCLPIFLSFLFLAFYHPLSMVAQVWTTTTSSFSPFGVDSAGGFAAIVLPIELLDFKGKYISPFGGQGAGNLLTWATANEVNNKGFEVERLMLKGDWETLGFVAPQPPKGENRAYTFLDTRVTPPLGVGGLYYRLRQIDNDGKETLS